MQPPRLRHSSPGRDLVTGRTVQVDAAELARLRTIARLVHEAAAGTLPVYGGGADKAAAAAEAEAAQRILDRAATPAGT